MKERKIRWQTKGTKSSIKCVQTGRHFEVIEENRETGEVRHVSESFNAVRAYLSYANCVEVRMVKALCATDPTPTAEEGMITICDGKPYTTNLKHPLIAELMEDFCDANGFPSNYPLTDQQRKQFDRMVVEYLNPGTSSQILESIVCQK